eukprot:GHVH01008791.1.p1 GENE.GHVH01008791.1~~GHVH01008791.1.p1  ORF type:complete len:726 (+),score=80.43 GHVH01008791.1:38-2215(+)
MVISARCYVEDVVDDQNSGCITSEISSIVSELHYGSDNTSLLKDPSVASTVLRSLSETQRLIVLRMLNLRVPVPDKHILMWLGNKSQMKFTVMDKLVKAKLLVPSDATSGASNGGSAVSASRSATLASSVSTNDKKQKSQKADCEASGVSIASSSKPSIKSIASPVTYRLDTNLFEGLQFALSNTSRDTHGCTSLVANSFATTPSQKVDINQYNQCIQRCYLEAYKRWNGFLRWCFNDGVNVYLHHIDGESPAITSIALFSTTEWRNQKIRTPPKILQKVAKELDLAPPLDGSVGWRNETFLFQPAHKQLSQLIVEYINQVNSTDDSKGNTDEIFTFFITLNQMKIGKACTFTGLKSSKNALLEDFVLFLEFLGVVIIEDVAIEGTGKSESLFYPTPLAKLVLCNAQEITMFASAMSSPHVTAAMVKSLVPHAAVQSTTYGFRLNFLGQVISPPSDTSHLDSATVAFLNLQTEASLLCPCVPEGIVVESNFKLFGYSNSSLIVSLISRFSVIRVITPTLVNAVLNRKSVHFAFSLGISAQQIIGLTEYLAHVKVQEVRNSKNQAMCPENVKIQVMMWEQERRRLRFRTAVLFEFNRDQDLDLFPVTVANCINANMSLSNTACPDNVNVNSDEFKKWKSLTLKEMRDRATRGDCCTAINAFNYLQIVPGQITAAPCLVVEAGQQSAVTNFVKYFRTKINSNRQNSSSSVAGAGVSRVSSTTARTRN